MVTSPKLFRTLWSTVYICI